MRAVLLVGLLLSLQGILAASSSAVPLTLQTEPTLQPDGAVQPGSFRRDQQPAQDLSTVSRAGLKLLPKEEVEETLTTSYHAVPSILAGSGRHGLDPLRIPLYIPSCRNFHWPIFRGAFEQAAELRTESTEGGEGEMDMTRRRLAEPEWYRAVRNIWYRAIRATSKSGEAETGPSSLMDGLERFVQRFFPASRLRVVLLWDTGKFPFPKSTAEDGEQIKIVHERPAFSFVAAGAPLFKARDSRGRELSFTSKHSSVVVHRFNSAGLRPHDPILIYIEFDDRQPAIDRSLYFRLWGERSLALSASAKYPDLPFESFPQPLKQWSRRMLKIYDDATRNYGHLRSSVHSPQSVFLKFFPYADIDYAVAKPSLPLIVRVSSKRGDVVPPEVPVMHIQSDTTLASGSPQQFRYKASMLRTPTLILSFPYADEMISKNDHLMTYDDAGWHYSLDTSSRPFRCSSKDPFAVVLIFNYDERRINEVMRKAAAMLREADVVAQQALGKKWASLTPKVPGKSTDKQREQPMPIAKGRQIIDQDALSARGSDGATEEPSGAEYVQEAREDEQREDDESRFEHKSFNPDPLHLHAGGIKSYRGDGAVEDGDEFLPPLIPISSPSSMDTSFTTASFEHHRTLATDSSSQEVVVDSAERRDVDYGDIEDGGQRSTAELEPTTGSGDRGTTTAMLSQSQQRPILQAAQQHPQAGHQSQLQSQDSLSSDAFVSNSGRSDAEF